MKLRIVEKKKMQEQQAATYTTFGELKNLIRSIINKQRLIIHYRVNRINRKYNNNLSNDFNYLIYDDKKFIFNVFKTSKKTMGKCRLSHR